LKMIESELTTNNDPSKRTLKKETLMAWNPMKSLLSVGT